MGLESGGVLGGWVEVRVRVRVGLGSGVPGARHVLARFGVVAHALCTRLEDVPRVRGEGLWVSLGFRGAEAGVG